MLIFGIPVVKKGRGSLLPFLCRCFLLTIFVSFFRKRHKASSEAQSTDGQEEGEVVSSRRKSRRTRESKQQEVKVEPSEQEEGQLPSP